MFQQPALPYIIRRLLKNFQSKARCAKQLHRQHTAQGAASSRIAEGGCDVTAPRIALHQQNAVKLMRSFSRNTERQRKRFLGLPARKLCQDDEQCQLDYDQSSLLLEH